jgi:hypothetical protein
MMSTRDPPVFHDHLCDLDHRLAGGGVIVWTFKFPRPVTGPDLSAAFGLDENSMPSD